nr:hypothetical protein [Tanacetum cinerariifolium]
MWNNSHDGYDCQQQFPFVYEQEPSYNQNYDDNYYPHESLSLSCCDYCGGSHETFQCQPDNQNVDFSGSDQIQTLQYPDVNPPSPKISNEEFFQAKGDLLKSIQTFLERFNCIPSEEKPQILFQTWETFFAIQCSQPEDSNELFQKLLKDLKELAEYDQSTRTDRPIFLNDNEDHPDSDIHQLIEECSVEVPEEQKQKIEDTILEMVKICQEKEFLCIHDDVDDLIESAIDSKLLSINSINSQRLDKKDKCDVTLENKIECDMPAKDVCSPVSTFSNPLFKDNDDLDSSNDECIYFSLLSGKADDGSLEMDRNIGSRRMSPRRQDDLLNQIRNFMQNLHDAPPGEDKKPEVTTDTELSSTEDIHPLAVQEPPHDFDICQLIREEFFEEVPEEQKQNMEKTMLELIEICLHKQILCMYDNIDDLIESALNSKLLLINSNSQRLNKKEQEVKNVIEQRAKRGNRSIKSLQNFKVVHKSSISFDTSQISSSHLIAPILSTKEPEHLLSMWYEHLSITPETESDKVTESNSENLFPISSKCEVTLEDKMECDVPISENSPVCNNHSDIFSDSKIDDDISVYD